MEGMEFQTPKGKMIFRKEDHQALQSMYAFKMVSKPDVAWLVPDAHARALAAGDGAPDPEQAMRRAMAARRRLDGVSLAVAEWPGPPRARPSCASTGSPPTTPAGRAWPTCSRPPTG